MPDSHAGLPDRTGEEERHGAPEQPRQGPQDGTLCHNRPLWFEWEFLPARIRLAEMSALRLSRQPACSITG